MSQLDKPFIIKDLKLKHTIDDDSKMKQKMIIKEQKGVAAVELALMLPVLILLFAGIIEFSIIYYNKQVITNASKEAARIGISDFQPETLPPELVDNAYFVDRVRFYCQNRLIALGGANDPNVTSTGVGGNDGTPLTVTVTYNHKLMLPSLLGLGPTVNLAAQTVMSNM